MIKEEFNELKFYIQYELYPELRDYLNEANPSEFKNWGGNCCRQSAITIAYCLYMTLPTKEYDVEVWESTFTDTAGPTKGMTYQHMWTFVKNKKDHSECIFIDVSRQDKSALMFLTDRNQYPTTLEFSGMFEHSPRKQVAWKDALGQNEYYTGKPGHTLLFHAMQRVAMKGKGRYGV